MQFLLKLDRPAALRHDHKVVFAEPDDHQP